VSTGWKVGESVMRMTLPNLRKCRVLRDGAVRYLCGMATSDRGWTGARARTEKSSGPFSPPRERRQVRNA